MKLIIVGQDNRSLDKASNLSKRLIEYGNLLDELLVVVPSDDEKKEVRLSNNVLVSGVGSGSRARIFFNVCKETIKRVKEDLNKDLLLSTKDPYFFSQILVHIQKKYKKNFELQIHGVEKLNFFRKFLFKRSLKYANSIRVVSERFKKYLVEEFNVDVDRIVVVPIFTDWRDIQQTEKETVIKREDDQFVFLTIGRLVPVKRIDLQIKAFASEFTGNTQARLIVIGRGPEKDSLKRITKSLGIENQVEFIDHAENVPSYINNADSFVLTSESEGWGLVLVESLALFTPIITTNVGLVGEVISSGTGVKVIDGVEELRVAMREALDDRIDKEKLKDSFTEMLNKLPTKEETYNLYKKSWEKAFSK